MTIISGPVKPVDHHPDARQSTATYSTSPIDLFEAGRRPSSEFDEIGKAATLEQGHGKAVYWLISLAAIISLLVGAPSLLESVTPRTSGTDQLKLAAQGTESCRSYLWSSHPGARSSTLVTGCSHSFGWRILTTCLLAAFSIIDRISLWHG
jgi:hypothetical protein